MVSKKSYFTVTEKGQVTIPSRVRRKLGIVPGTQLHFEIHGNKIVITKATASDPVSAVFGVLGRHNTDKILARLRSTKS